MLCQISVDLEHFQDLENMKITVKNNKNSTKEIHSVPPKDVIILNNQIKWHKYILAPISKNIWQVKESDLKIIINIFGIIQIIKLEFEIN